jgi:hypothetical protein
MHCDDNLETLFGGKFTQDLCKLDHFINIKNICQSVVLAKKS